MAYNNLFKGSVRSYMEFGEDLLTAFIKSSLSFGFLLFATVLACLYVHFVQEAALPVWSYVLLFLFFNGLLLSLGFFKIGVMSLRGLRDQTKGYIEDDQPVKERPIRTRAKLPVTRKPLSLN